MRNLHQCAQNKNYVDHSDGFPELDVKYVTMNFVETKYFKYFFYHQSKPFCNFGLAQRPASVSSD